MFRHILVPTDGSPLSLRSAKRAVSFAKGAGARITAFYAGPQYTVQVYGDFVPPDLLSPQEFARQSKRAADRYLAAITKMAKASGVRCQTLYVVSNSPWEAIVKAAKSKKCDLVFMASHGRRGLTGLLLGSETQKVLTHSKVPVLVHR